MSFRTVQGEQVTAEVRRSASGSVEIAGAIHRFQGKRQLIRWIAPNKPTRGISFNGSGMPFANYDQAFENTPFQGLIQSNDGSFSILLTELPNAFYTSLGSTYVPPVLMLETTSDEGKFKTHLFLSPTAVPFRWTAGAPPGPLVVPNEEERGRAMYYNGREDLPIFKNQEALLRARGYPADDASQGLPDHLDKYPWINTPSPA